MIDHVVESFTAAAVEVGELAGHFGGPRVRRQLDELAVRWLLGRRGIARARAEALLEHVADDVGAKLEIRAF